MLLPGTIPILGNWGIEVGRADGEDVKRLIIDWAAFKAERTRLDREGLDRKSLAEMIMIERQKQFLGSAEEDRGPQQMFEKVQDKWLNNVMGPLQRIALNPAATCAEAQFALTTMFGMRRQQQMLGLDESEMVNRVYQATEQMASLRCRDEALDECVATGRFRQILDLMSTANRQTQMMGGEGDLESWADDALKQCAIYEIHFVSTTKSGHPPAVNVETVRDGRVKIRYKTPPGGLKAASGPLGEVLKGKTTSETTSGSNPFFVSVKCSSVDDWLKVGFICSPGADSTPIEIRINALDLKHREFYIDYGIDKNTLKETEFSKWRLAGEDEFSFEFEGGNFALQGLIKTDQTSLEVPLNDWGLTFYGAHDKDQIGPMTLNIKNIKNIKRGVHPAVLQFTYKAEAMYFGFLAKDSTEFELIHRPEPKPFRKLPDPIRKPLKPKPNQL
jgi:hypothetical protein